MVIFIDWFSKWTEIFPVKNVQSKTVARIFVREIICRHGAPRELLSDQGPTFQSQLMKDVCETMNVCKTFSRPYCPQTQGIVERFNRTLLSMLMTSAKDLKNWDEAVPFLQLAYNSAIHSTTGYSSFYLLHGRQPVLPMDMAYEIPPEKYQSGEENFVSEIRSNPSIAWKIAEEKIAESQTAMIKQQASNVKDYDFQVGDIVKMRIQEHRTNAISSKLQPLWTGPCKILKRDGLNVTLVEVDSDSKNFGKQKVVHIQHLLPYIVKPPALTVRRCKAPIVETTIGTYVLQLCVIGQHQQFATPVLAMSDTSPPAPDAPEPSVLLYADQDSSIASADVLNANLALLDVPMVAEEIQIDDEPFVLVNYIVKQEVPEQMEQGELQIDE